LYVDDDAAKGGDGASWATAYSDLNQALLDAARGSEIWVARGRYQPTSGKDRSAAFVMKEGVSVYGGFKGTESKIEQRNWSTNVTLLSGNIGALQDSSDNAYHVLIGASDSLVDGFTIQEGRADGEFLHSRGGGLLCKAGASPLIRNCTFIDNHAVEGGGIACVENAAPLLTDCIISGNTARSGAGILLRKYPDTKSSGAQITGSNFLNNTAQERGGAVYIDDGACPTFSECTLSGNTSSGNGGGVYVDNNSSAGSKIQTRFNFCRMTENVTSLRGGAFSIHEGRVVINDSTITNNAAVNGGGGIALEYRGDYANVNSSSVIEKNMATSGKENIDDQRMPGFGRPE
jgi:hypothetical protein